jgi:membrane-bound lytic murein transglycosylase MltF
MPLVRTRSKSLAALVACAVIAACGNDRASDGAPAAVDSVPLEAPVPTVNAADIAADIAADTPADDPAHGVTPGERLPLSFGRIWQPWFGDFDAMVERRIVRAVVPYGGYQFFYEDGQPRGATYELLQRLEQHLNAELKRGNLKVYVVVVPLGRDELIPALLEGHADLIAGDLTITGERASRLAFTRPLLTDINEIVVTGPAAAPVDAMDDLAGRDIVVRASSSYFEHLQERVGDFRARGLEPPEIVPADEILEAEDLLEMLDTGMIGITVLDDYKAEFWASVFPNVNLREDLVINQGGAIAWAMRPASPQFESMLEGFMKAYGKGTMIGNDTYNRYLADAGRVRCSHSPQALETLSELVTVFEKYGSEYEFDWLMLAAQSFQESKFQQDRRSSAGAVGVMQIKPSTAADPNVGVDDISTIDGNVHAGSRYMRFLADRYFSSEEFDPLGQWLFSLAAYNAGPARVAQLRKEAAESGYDAARWFDNVEIVAARRLGQETVSYVSNVFKYYVGYQLSVGRGTVLNERYASELQECADAPG